MKNALLNMIFTLAVVLTAPPLTRGTETAQSPAQAVLSHEVHGRGWIAASAQTDAGDWDIFLMRPDGSERRNITHTPEDDEMGVRFSPDGRRILYRRITHGQKFGHDSWGAVGKLVIAAADGSNPVVIGQDGEFPWASWSPDGRQVACLARSGIEFWDLATKTRLRTLSRKGIFEQMFWSPDGKWLTGTANSYGEAWSILRMNALTGDVNLVTKFQNCTSDFAPDSDHIIYSSRPANQKVAENAAGLAQRPGYGWTQLWMAEGGGTRQALIYGEDGTHAYGGALSPDGKYVLFTRSPTDGGLRTGMINLMRLADAPTIGGESKSLRQLHPDAKDGPVIQLAPGWEPHWTYTEIGSGK
jgi:dipeptidyl aminopeptidase/acylaminoacyl peptidase